MASIPRTYLMGVHPRKVNMKSKWRLNFYNKIKNETFTVEKEFKGPFPTWEEMHDLCMGPDSSSCTGEREVNIVIDMEQLFD